MPIQNKPAIAKLLRRAADQLYRAPKKPKTTKVARDA